MATTEEVLAQLDAYEAKFKLAIQEDASNEAQLLEAIAAVGTARQEIQSLRKQIANTLAMQWFLK